MRRNITLISILLCVMVFYWILHLDNANSGPYLNSAHGSSSYGVDRSTIDGVNPFPDYAKGNCAHCHEQHASVGGVTTTPSKYVLFYDNYVSQTDGVCFKCHTDLSSYQTGGLVNRSYSYRAGGWIGATGDPLNDILEAFTNPPSISSHNLGNIRTFITGKWNYTADSNPCAACHNPHRAQRDPHTTTSRGWPVSRPIQHSKDNNAWGLWGDDLTEKMSNYTANYQSPYRYNSTTTYEPDGSTTINGSNLTDYVTFCTDCHNTSNTIYSTTLGRNLKSIDWNNEKHGKGDADGSLCGDAPYPSGTSGLGKVLSCLDCHEPHGSPNAFLIRKEVNGNVLGGSIGSFSTTNWHYLCDRCHKDDKEIDSGCQEDHYYLVHHKTTGCNTEPPYSLSMCGSCHTNVGGPPPPDSCLRNEDKIICTNCHYHGSTAGSRRTF